ncbi:NUDIX domain-containing protein [Bacillus sp. FJAT-49711]|uniref:NUDIX domain-containing protein n=1 Tax=Bacillus sp. FJAT-49711 TaxID=2833585 RepID=UPI001BCA4146|nr:NUDIX domain-containing protein [Bacillus sp. FJAT-49711]MBS4218784.1 NUDIX domain-containing protein [Bacillus sp. FJAT-49711]
MNSLRVMTTAYLFCGDSVLLMERSSQKSFIPGVWSGIGGHVESNEHGDLMSACLREIEEETGLLLNNLDSISLKYIVLRQSKSELRQQFIYFGNANTKQISTSDEGTLHWIPCDQIFSCKMTDSNRLMLEHFFNNKKTDEVFVGAMYGEESQPHIHWTLVSDWEK